MLSPKERREKERSDAIVLALTRLHNEIHAIRALVSNSTEGQQAIGQQDLSQAGAHPPNPLSAIRTVTQFPAAYNSQQAAESKNNFRLQRRGFWIQFLLFVATALAFVAAWRYADIAEAQWKDLRHNFQVDQRAWLKVNSGFPTVPPSSLPYVSIGNVGKSPSFGGAADIEVQVVPKNSAPNFVLHSDLANHIDLGLGFPGEPSGPMMIKPVESGKSREFSASEITGLTEGTDYLVAYGIVVYSDQFGAHWTRFCAWHYYVTGDSPAGARTCVFWNAQGDGLPPGN